MDLNRRQLIGMAGAFGAVTVLSSCAGFSKPPTAPTGSKELSFTTWGSATEEAGFKTLIADFEKKNTGVTVKLNVVPYEQMFSNIDAQLQSGTAPDIFRVDYGTLGVYSSKKQLLDLSPYFDKAASDAFIPAMWQAIQYKGKPYGVPHQTDTSAIVYNKAMMTAAGITTFPDKLASAWTWEEFDQVNAKVRASLAPELFPFTYNWQLFGAPRWFSWLFQAGGRYLADDLVTPAIDSPAGAKALDYTRALFTKKYVPDNTSVKSSSYADNVFVTGTIAMASVGNFTIPDVNSIAKFEWGATYLPRDVRGADDLGGNALVATAGTKNPDLAAEFLRFMVEEKNMETFVTGAMELPTLQSLAAKNLTFPTRPDVMPVFVQQSTTIQPSDVAQLASPAMAAISTALNDQLELAFLGGQSTPDTLKNLSTAIAAATKA